MDAADLARWTRFAAKGGIGRCTAIQDCIAEGGEDLMFLQDDEITVLMQLPEEGLYLGSCEGVVGRFQGSHVRFHSRLKKPVYTRRTSASPNPVRGSPAVSPDPSLDPRDDFRTSQRASSSRLPDPTEKTLEHAHSPVLSSKLSDGAPRSKGSTPEERVADVSWSASSSQRISKRSPSASPQFAGKPEMLPGEAKQPASVKIPTRTSSLLPSPRELIPSPPPSASPLLSASTAAPLTLHDGEHLSNNTPLSDSLSPPPTTTPDRSEEPRSAAQSILVEEDSRPSSKQLTPSTRPPDSAFTDAIHLRPNDTVDLSRISGISQGEDDGAFGIGLSLLQQMTNDSEDSAEEDSDRDVTILDHQPPPDPKSDGERVDDDESEMPSDSDAAEDIFDNYRYSRFSMASKLSKGSGTGAPPLPDSQRPSFDRRDTDNSVYSIPSPTTTRRIPPALDMTSAGVSTSLKLSTAISSPLPSPLPSASALREKFEREAPAEISMATEESAPAVLAYDQSSASVSGLDQSHASTVGLGLQIIEDPSSPPRVADTSILSEAENSVVLSVEGSPPQPIESTPTTTTPRSPPGSPTLPLNIRSKRRPVPIDVASTAPLTIASQGIEATSQAPSTPHPVSSPPRSEPSSAPLTPQGSVLSVSQGPLPSPTLSVQPPPSASFSPTTPVPHTNSSPPPRIFAPHPNAPIAPPSTGSPRQPLYMQARPQYPPPGPSSHLTQTLRGTAPGQTIYGRMEWDLSNSRGPVPISFSSEMMVPSRIAPAPVVHRSPLTTQPPIMSHSLSEPVQPQRLVLMEATPSAPAATRMPAPNVAYQMEPAAQQSPSHVAHPIRTQVSAASNQIEISAHQTSQTHLPTQVDNLSSPVVPSNEERTAPSQGPRKLRKSPSARGRLNIVPQPTRSSNEPAEASSEMSQDQRISSKETDPSPTQRQMFIAGNNPSAALNSLSRPNFAPMVGAQRPRSRSFSEFESTLLIQTGQGVMSGKDASLGDSPPRTTSLQPDRALGYQHHITRPSPLAALQQSLTASRSVTSLSQPSSPVVKAPDSPLLPPAALAHSNSSRSSLPTHPTSLRHVASAAALTSERHRRVSGASGGRASMQAGRPSIDTEASHASHGRSATSPTPPSVGRSNSLRSKISLSNIRNRRKEADAIVSPVEMTEEKVQVKDMEFELVRPRLAGHHSFDSPNEKVASPDSEQHPSGSPSSLRLPGSFRSEGFSSADSLPPAVSASKTRPPTPDGNLEAHRARELKWLSFVSSTTPREAQKSKKVRKLVLEGVPASVRARVWGHLVNSQARRMAEVYGNLGKRERVPATEEIQRDVIMCFPDQPHLRDPKGPVVGLLQGFMTIVPDIKYHISLTRVAGQLLTHTPEEDAFWTFIAVMDNDLRPYFMNTNQSGIDASIFLKLADQADAQLSNRLFGEMGVQARDLCHPWFSSLFTETLPPAHLLRVWDMFFYEGPVFLFRVGLSILSLARRTLMAPSFPTRQALVQYLLHPPATLFTLDAEAFLNLALSFKVKDDDLKKQRAKLEAQSKKNAPAPSKISGGNPPMISLPAGRG